VDSPCTLHGSAETCFLVFALRRARSQAENAGKCGKLLNIPMKPISEEQRVLPDIAGSTGNEGQAVHCSMSILKSRYKLRRQVEHGRYQMISCSSHTKPTWEIGTLGY
jgi:hypothetical protein